MSRHLIQCVWETDLKPSHAMALQAFADSAEDITSRIGFPGLPRVMKMAQCSRSRAYELISDLVDRGYLAKHHAGHRGRRAEYVVFPDGCCEEHADGDTEVDEEAFLAQAAALGLDPAQLQALLAASRKGPADQTQTDAPSPVEKGSTTPDAPAGKGSGTADPHATEGSTEGPAHGTPTRTTTTSPPSPHEWGATVADEEDAPLLQLVPSTPDATGCQDVTPSPKDPSNGAGPEATGGRDVTPLRPVDPHRDLDYDPNGELGPVRCCPRHPEEPSQGDCRGCRTTPRQVEAWSKHLAARAKREARAAALRAEVEASQRRREQIPTDVAAAGAALARQSLGNTLQTRRVRTRG